MNETITLSVQNVDIGAMPLVADIQYLEPFGSQSLNRKFSGVLGSGITQGFTPIAGGGLSVSILHDQNLTGEAVPYGVALVEYNGYLISVRQQQTINLAVLAGQTTYLVVDAFYQHGVTTDQIDAESAQKAADILALTEAELLDHHVIICTVTLDAEATEVLAENISIIEPRDNLLNQYVMKTSDRQAMIVPNGESEDIPNKDGLQRWNPLKKRMEGSKAGKWQGMGGGGSTLSTVEVDTALTSGAGCLVDTKKVLKEIVVTLSPSPSEGDEHIVGDKTGFAHLYPIKVVAYNANGEQTTINGFPQHYINVDFARVTYNYNPIEDNWEFSSGFGERSSPKSIYNRFEAQPPAGTTLFTVPYTVGYVDVLINGAEQAHADYTANDGQNIILNKGTLAGQVVVIKAYQLCDKLEDIVYTRKSWSGRALKGAASISVTGLENDVAKAYRFIVGGVIQIADKDYSVSSLTGEVTFLEKGQPSPLDGDYDWYLLAEAQVTLFQALDKNIEVDNTNNSLTGVNVKENFDELDAKVGKLTDYNENLFINSNGLINQREHSGNLATSGYTLDRWFMRGADVVGGTVNVEQIASLPLGGTAIQLETITATDYASFEQRVEDASRELQAGVLEGKKLTLSFEGFGSVGSEALSVEVNWHDITNVTAKAVTTVANFDLTDAKQKFVTTFPIPPLPSDYDIANKYALSVRIRTAGIAADSTRAFGRLKLERGDKATPCVFLGRRKMLCDCRRYYEASARRRYAALYYGLNSTYRVINIEFNTIKRAVPSIAFTTEGWNGATLYQQSVDGFHVGGHANQSSDGAILHSIKADAEIY